MCDGGKQPSFWKSTQRSLNGSEHLAGLSASGKQNKHERYPLLNNVRQKLNHENKSQRHSIALETPQSKNGHTRQREIFSEPMWEFFSILFWEKKRE